MFGGRMIADLDRTLQYLLEQELPADVVSQVAISFEPPDVDFPPSTVSLPAIDLFLYDIRENLDLRSNEWIFERESDLEIRRRRAAVRINCSYLITAWASNGTQRPSQDEHQLLGLIMMVLLRHRTITQDYLQGALRQQDIPLPTTVLQSGTLQSMGEFWQALGGKPKAAINFTVTIGADPYDPITIPLVRETTTTIEDEP
jgi:hypothetical protein